MIENTGPFKAGETRPNVIVWIKLMRSGKYKHGTGRLFIENDNTHCCLGIPAAECTDMSWYGQQSYLDSADFQLLFPGFMEEGLSQAFLAGINDATDSYEAVITRLIAHFDLTPEELA